MAVSRNKQHVIINTSCLCISLDSLCIR